VQITITTIHYKTTTGWKEMGEKENHAITVFLQIDSQNQLHQSIHHSSPRSHHKPEKK
jgi:hypothetical protein